MNLHRAYILLAAFYTMLVALGVVALMAGGATFVIIIQIGVGALAVTGLWGYVLRKGFLNPRIWRPLSFILAAGVLVQAFLLFSTSPSHTQITQLLLGIVFSTLLIVFIYRYGERDQDLWATPHQIEGGKVLRDLLAEQQRLEVEKQEADRQATVNISREGKGYRASVTRARGGQVEQFEERFTCPSTLAFFIETYTCITVEDIVRKYHDIQSA